MIKYDISLPVNHAWRPDGESPIIPAMRLALYEPDIPQNAGTLIRLAVCLGLAVDVVEPCGFVWDDRKLRRAGMDYLNRADIQRHVSWRAFFAEHESRRTRLVLITTHGDERYTDYAFRMDDCLLVGRESAGVPADVHAAADARLRIPLAAGERSLNVAVAAAMVVGEALRQTQGFPEPRP